MRARLWHSGALYTPGELMESALGGEIDVKYYADYLAGAHARGVRGVNMKVKLSLSREKRSLGHENARGLILRAVKAALKAEGVEEPCAVSALLTDNEGIREINREYRGIDSATDVLSFPMNQLVPGEFDAAECERDLDTAASCSATWPFRSSAAPCRARNSDTVSTTS